MTAETQLIGKIKQCNDFLFRDPATDAETGALLDMKEKEFKTAISEKTLAISDLQKRCNSLERRVAMSNNSKNDKLEKLENKCGQLREMLQAKDDIILRLQERFKEQENDIINHKIRVDAVLQEKTQMVNSLKKVKSKAHERGIKNNKLTLYLKNNVKKMEEWKKERLHHYKQIRAKNDEINTLKKEADERAAENAALSLSNSELKSACEEKTFIIKLLEDTVQDLKAEVDQENVTIYNLIRKLEQSMSQMKYKGGSVEAEKRKRDMQPSEWQDQPSETQSNREDALIVSRHSTVDYVSVISEYHGRISEYKDELKALKARLKSKENHIKRLHQEISELRGNLPLDEI